MWERQRRSQSSSNLSTVQIIMVTCFRDDPIRVPYEISSPERKRHVRRPIRHRIFLHRTKNGSSTTMMMRFHAATRVSAFVRTAPAFRAGCTIRMMSAVPPSVKVRLESRSKRICRCLVTRQPSLPRFSRT